jgi:hypothetical protein
MTEATSYTRPTKTEATKIGDRRRHHWTHVLRQRARQILPIISMMTAEEVHAQRVRSRPGQALAAWMGISLRFDQIAVLEVLQQMHLQNTGKEISRSEVMAALMAHGLEGLAARDEFSK